MSLTAGVLWNTKEKISICDFQGAFFIFFFFKGGAVSSFGGGGKTFLWKFLKRILGKSAWYSGSENTGKKTHMKTN